MTIEELAAQARRCPACTPLRYCDFHAAAHRFIVMRGALQHVETALFANLTLEEKLAASIAVAELRAERRRASVDDPPTAPVEEPYGTAQRSK